MGYILITGGAGYIGSILSSLLFEENQMIIIIDDLSSGNIKSIPEESIFYRASCGDKNILREIFEKYKVDVVYHLAASANVPDSVQNPLEYYKNNVINSINLLEMMIKYNVNKIIFSSSAAVYGEPQYTPIDEDHELSSINPYGRSKIMVEQVIMDLNNAYGFKYHIFRYFCAAGATSENGESRKSKETHLIPLVAYAALGKRNHVDVFGDDYPTIDGTGVRDYLHVLDIAKAHILALEALDDHPNEVFNLGTETGYSVLEVIDTAQIVLGKEIPYKIAPRRTGDTASLVSSSVKIRDMLGWEPKYGLEDMIESAYEWRNNPKY